MVFYFTIPQGNVVYMGKDKYENEDLIKYSWDEDIWFHVDDFSSAHVYVRLKEDQTLDTIPQSVIDILCQLTKYNSIEGSKRNKVNIIYTPASNLKKTNNMETGSVSFYNSKLRKFVKNVPKDKDLIREILKTKVEEYPDLQFLKKQHEDEIMQKNKELQKNEILKQKQEEKEKLLKKLQHEEQRKEWDQDDDEDDEDDDVEDFI